MQQPEIFAPLLKYLQLSQMPPLMHILANFINQETQALEAITKAVRLAEPEGYIRRFVDEGASMETLLRRLREQQSEERRILYLDRLLATFHRQSKTPKRQLKQTRARNKLSPS